MGQSLKKLKFNLLTDIDMLLMVLKCIRSGICHVIHQYAKAIKKYMKHYNKTKKASYLKFSDVNNAYGWAMSQKLPLGSINWVEENLNLMKIS